MTRPTQHNVARIPVSQATRDAPAGFVEDPRRALDAVVARRGARLVAALRAAPSGRLVALFVARVDGVRVGAT
jgi:hypothetical protein